MFLLIRYAKYTFGVSVDIGLENFGEWLTICQFFPYQNIPVYMYTRLYPFNLIEGLPPISLKRFPRTLSAPATLRLHRQNSAKIYTSKMIVKLPPKRAQSAITSQWMMPHYSIPYCCTMLYHYTVLYHYRAIEYTTLHTVYKLHYLLKCLSVLKYSN